jgi:hypothetical protein
MHAGINGTAAGQTTGGVRFPMLKRITCCAPLCAVVLASCGDGFTTTLSEVPYLSLGYYNDPKEIRFVDDIALPKPNVSGSFQGRFGFGGGKINFGGGCLVFQEANHVLPCKLDSALPTSASFQTASQCPLFDSNTGRSYGVYGYCHKETETCWYKPDDSYCEKVIKFYPGTWNLGPKDALPPNTTGSILWRVVTCQNDDTSLCKNPGGGIRRWGDFSRLR